MEVWCNEESFSDYTVLYVWSPDYFATSQGKPTLRQS